MGEQVWSAALKVPPYRAEVKLPHSKDRTTEGPPTLEPPVRSGK